MHFVVILLPFSFHTQNTVTRRTHSGENTGPRQNTRTDTLSATPPLKSNSHCHFLSSLPFPSLIPIPSIISLLIPTHTDTATRIPHSPNAVVFPTASHPSNPIHIQHWSRSTCC